MAKDSKTLLSTPRTAVQTLQSSHKIVVRNPTCYLAKILILTQSTNTESFKVSLRTGSFGMTLKDQKHDSFYLVRPKYEIEFRTKGLTYITIMYKGPKGWGIYSHSSLVDQNMDINLKEDHVEHIDLVEIKEEKMFEGTNTRCKQTIDDPDYEVTLKELQKILLLSKIYRNIQDIRDESTRIRLLKSIPE